MDAILYTCTIISDYFPFARKSLLKKTFWNFVIIIIIWTKRVKIENCCKRSVIKIIKVKLIDWLIIDIGYKKVIEPDMMESVVKFFFFFFRLNCTNKCQKLWKICFYFGKGNYYYLKIVRKRIMSVGVMT